MADQNLSGKCSMSGRYNIDLLSLDRESLWAMVMVMVNGKCRLPYTVLDIKGFLQFTLLDKSVAQIYFTLKLILLLYY